MRIITFFFLILYPYGISCSFILGLGVVGVASLFSGWKYTSCLFGRCCKGSWYNSDFQALQKDLQLQLHGQHIAEEVLLRHLKSHYLDGSPKKALVLSLHGTTGSGKNFITSIVIKRILQNGDKNENYKLWNAKHSFSDSDKLEQYKADVKRTIRAMVSKCPRSIFVFDETNDLPSGLLDILKPMMDGYPQLDGIDYRKAAFFFLSNTGSTTINQVTLRSKKGNTKLDRTSLSLRDFQSLIQDGAFTEKGGLLRSKLIEKNLIDAYIPFLPMEKDQIKLCIKDFLQSKRCPSPDTFIERVADLVNYEPPGFKYFASYGCRGIENLVKQEIDDDACLYSPSKSEF